MCVIAAVGDAPCQCFSPGGNHTTSPGLISATASPQHCARPQPAVTINVWPNGCVCQAVRAPGSNVTLAPRTRAGSGASNKGSIRTVPVNQSAGPFVELCEPDLFISIFQTSSLRDFLSTINHLRSTFSCKIDNRAGRSRATSMGRPATIRRSGEMLNQSTVHHKPLTMHAETATT